MKEWQAAMPRCAPVLRFLCLLLVAPLVVVRAESTDKFYAAVYGQEPHVFVSVLVTNSRHALSNFLGYLENLDYPKDRISLWFRTDHNVDGTAFALQSWCRAVSELYKSVDCEASYRWTYPTKNPYSKSVHRSKNKARLRQQALEAALTASADYLLTLDVDCFLVNPKTLRVLIDQDKTIVSPMLDSTDGVVNFWMGNNENLMGRRESYDELYGAIVKRQRVGCFQCSVVYGVVLVHLASPYAENLVYHPPHPRFLGPVDDVQQFAFSAQQEGQGVGMNIVNTEFFGYIMPNNYKYINDAMKDFSEFKIHTLARGHALVYSQYMRRKRPHIRNAALGLDAIYVINLARRPERRARMSAVLDEMGYNHTIFNAIDGRNLNDSYLEEELGIRYSDTGIDDFVANDRKMRKGEVGAFLSHYFIWKKMLQEKQDRVLVMEDDVHFKSFFNSGLSGVLSEANRHVPLWDFIYLGRHKVNETATERRVPKTKWLVKPTHSFFTLCYLLTRRGAEKLLASDPFHSLLPAGEFISVMLDNPPRGGRQWELEYPVRNLEGYSAHPTLVEPTHFVGDKDYISDTAPAEEIASIFERKRKAEESEEDKQMRQTIRNKALQRQIGRFKNTFARNEL